jgi:hypothetical protein
MASSYFIEVKGCKKVEVKGCKKVIGLTNVMPNPLPAGRTQGNHLQDARVNGRQNAVKNWNGFSKGIAMMELSNHKMGNYLYLISGIVNLNLNNERPIGVDPGLRNMVSYIESDDNNAAKSIRSKHMRQINGSKKLEVNNATLVHNYPWLAGSFESLSILTPKANNTHGEFQNLKKGLSYPSV